MGSEWIFDFILYLVFLLVTYRICLLIFLLTTYHEDFLKWSPLLIGYAILIGGLMAYIEPFHKFWFTQIWGSALLFLFTWRSQAKQTQKYLESYVEDADERSFSSLSVASTKTHYLLSVLIYLVAYVIAFLLFLNAFID